MNSMCRDMATSKAITSKLTLAALLCVSAPLPISHAASLGDIADMPIDDILLESTKLQCVDWQLSGGCLWLKCSLFSSCSVNFSLKVKHWSPSLLVEVRRSQSDTPLGYTSLFNGAFKEGLETVLSVFGFRYEVESNNTGNNGQGASNPAKTSTLRFSDVGVHGNAGITLYDQLYGAIFGSLGWCNNPALPLSVYYDSMLDGFEWRWGLSEAVRAWSNTPTILGPVNNLDVYGELYPRIGYVNQASPYKAASTLAYRAVHIATESPDNHITVDSFPNKSSTNKSWAVPAMSNSTSRWTDVVPKSGLTCGTLAQSTGTSIVESSVHTNDEQYLKIYWSQFECCKKRGNKLIGEW
ncbi:integrating conjugative element protein, PFL_4710 family [Vibrio xiamenensis]|uniref:Integrating conjugative element protein, PFL_4710 family n=2 Tax=Vibrio xiamenensis TaxID=861298 RepID=A0A1G8FHS0_9VIBR|nr:integrating conjugative element protein, PFL_4710 family [Vibrio xiamenensis]